MSITQELILESQNLINHIQLSSAKQLIQHLTAFTVSFIDEMSEEDYLRLRIAIATIGKISLNFEEKALVQAIIKSQEQYKGEDNARESIRTADSN